MEKSVPAGFEVLLFEREISGSVIKSHMLRLWILKTSLWFSLSFEETGKFGKTEKNGRKRIPKWATKYLFCTEVLVFRFSIWFMEMVNRFQHHMLL